jgi:hypothetical protein
VSRPTAAETARARRLLELERATDVDVEVDRDDVARTAAARVHDKLQLHLAALVGPAGVQMLFARSARLVQDEHAGFAGIPMLGGSTSLRECLQADDPPVTEQAATAFFGTFFALMTTLIGERLTTQVLRRAWPAIEEAEPPEGRDP